MNEQLKVIITAEVAKFKAAMGSAKAEFKDFKNQVKSVDTKTIENNFSKLGDGINKSMKLAAAGAATLVTALVGASIGTQEFQGDMAALSSAYEQAGFSAETASSTMSRLYGVIGETDTSVEAAQQIALLANSEAEVAKWGELASGVMGTFGDALKPETFYEAANETLKLGEATGAFVQMLEGTGVMSVDEFNAALAACTTEEEKQALMLEVSQKAMGEAGKAWDEATGKLQEQRQAQLEMQTALADVGAAVAPVVTEFMRFASDALGACVPYFSDIANNLAPTLANVLTTVASALADAFKWASQHKALMITMATVIAVITTAITLYNVVAAVKAAMAVAEVTTVWGLVAAYTAQAIAMMAALAPYLLIAAAVAAFIAILVKAYKENETFRNIVNKVFNNIKDIITKVMNVVKTVISTVWDTIKFIWDNGLKQVLNIVINILAKIVEDFTNRLNAVMTIVKGVFTAVSNVIKSSLETAKTIVDNVLKLIKAIFTGDFEGAKQAVVNIFNAIKTHISNVLNAAKGVVQSVLDAIRGYFGDKLNAAKTIVSNVFNSIKDSIEDKINSAKDKVENAIEKIKSFMNFSWSLPKPKIPKFNVSGGKAPWGFMGQGSLPKITITWLARGGVFDSATLFGFGNGQLGGLGEDGAEAVVPLEKNLGWLDKLASMLDERLGGSSPTLILQVDGKTFGEVSIDNINKITRQTGNLPLVLS